MTLQRLTDRGPVRASRGEWCCPCRSTPSRCRSTVRDSEDRAIVSDDRLVDGLQPSASERHPGVEQGLRRRR